MTKQAIGIMGGTFDPIHNGHLLTAECAAYKYNLEKVIFVPSGNPPHKTEQKITNAEHRYLMATLATISNSKFSVSKIEIKRRGLSYTIDTVREFKKMYPNHKLFFITGTDAIMEIFDWKSPRNLLQEADFIAASRPGYSLEDIKEKISGTYKEEIHLLKIPGLAISSTNIRQRVRDGRPIKYQLPEAVENYIRQKTLYRRQLNVD